MIFSEEVQILEYAKVEGIHNCRAFLQLLISFRIATDYEKDELLEILIPASTQKEALDMCRSLGLSLDVG